MDSEELYNRNNSEDKESGIHSSENDGSINYDQFDNSENSSDLHSATSEGISDSNEISEQMQKSQFERYVKEVFNNSVTRPLGFREYQKYCASLIELPLPEDMKFPFFDIHTILYLIPSYSPLMKKYEEKTKKTKKLKGLISDNFDEIQKFYLKWAVASSEADRKYFAASALKLIEKNTNQDNFLKNILEALIYAYDKKDFYNPEKAIRILDKIEKDLLSGSIDPVLRDDFLFIIKIINGIILLMRNKYEEARNEFFTLRSKRMHSPIPLYFYIITELELGQTNKAAELFNELLNMDIIMLNYAIRHNNTNVFDHVLHFAHIYSIFHSPSSTSIFNRIHGSVERLKADPNIKISNLKQWYNNLQALELQNYYTEEIRKDLHFFEQFFEAFLTTRNGFIMIVFENLLEKFFGIIAKIKSAIEQKFHGDIKRELVAHDKNIRESEEEIAVIREEIERLEEKLRSHADELKERVEKIAEVKKRETEEKILQLEELNESKYADMFRKAMLNNILISAIMFIVGGIFGGLSKYAEADPEGGNSFIRQAVSSGLQWAAIIFLLGIIVSLVITIFSKSRSKLEKAKLENHLETIDKEKEREIERVSDEIETKREKMERVNNDRINTIMENVRKNELEKKEKELELRQKVQAEIKSIFSQLDKVHK